MTAEIAETLVGALAERLGVEPKHIEALALSMSQPTAQDETADSAAIVRFVASLIGACPVCLGENPGCLECGGNGTPGCRPPNETALVAWISRPLRRLGLCVGRPRRALYNDDNHGGGYG